MSNRSPNLLLEDILESANKILQYIVLRKKKSNTIVGQEVKKLIQQSNGADPRGMTIDYNSCLPCGKTLIKIRDDKFDNSFHYVVIDNTSKSSIAINKLPVRRDIFKACKERKPKERVASMLRLRP